MTARQIHLHDLPSLVGQEVGVSDCYLVTQQAVDAYAAATTSGFAKMWSGPKKNRPLADRKSACCCRLKWRAATVCVAEPVYRYLS